MFDNIVIVSHMMAFCVLLYSMWRLIRWSGVSSQLLFSFWCALWCGLAPGIFLLGIDDVHFAADIQILAKIHGHYNIAMMCMVSAANFISENHHCGRGVYANTGRVETAYQIGDRLSRGVHALALFGSILLFFTVDISDAPLIRLLTGAYGHGDLMDGRQSFYRTDGADMLAIPRYLTLYVFGPASYFVMAYERKTKWIVGSIVFFVSVLTLAKTAAMLLFVFAAIGFFVTGSKMKCIVCLLASTIVFVAIVSATYGFSRDLSDILYVLWARILLIPSALSLLYCDWYSLDMNMRSSFWYTLPFGGNEYAIAKDAFHRVTFGASVFDGNAPAGIVGTMQPNIPKAMHYPWMMAVTAYVCCVSIVTSNIRGPGASVIACVFGAASAFIFLTDTLTAMNSYGVMWLGIIAVVVRIRQLGRFVDAQ